MKKTALALIAGSRVVLN